MADVRPFDFKRLPKVSRQDLRLLEGLQSFLPRVGFSEDLGRSIKRLLAKELGLSFSFQREKIATVDLTATLRSLSHQGVYALFGMTPLEGKAILEIDPFMAQMAIDRLLGGKGEPLTMIRPLTEIEEGVLSYLFLKILAHIFERCGRSARVHFRLEGFRSSSDEILPMVKQGESGVLILLRITFGERAGYARLILPSPFVQRALLEPLEAAQAAGMFERDLQYYAARLENLGFLQTTLWAEVGRTTLKAKEMKGLEAGDVVLLERTGARVKDGKLDGFLPVRVGRGDRGAFRGQIISEKIGAQKRAPLRLQLHGMEMEHPVGKGS